VPVSFYDVPFDNYRALGFAGADDMGNMHEHHAILRASVNIPAMPPYLLRGGRTCPDLPNHR
jgi:hypothetical protein